jgi:hypothetical protein
LKQGVFGGKVVFWGLKRAIFRSKQDKIEGVFLDVTNSGARETLVLFGLVGGVCFGPLCPGEGCGYMCGFGRQSSILAANFADYVAAG